ncbi:MAG TPA: DUF3368 domain-containing protein [Acidobacteriaceae bacterium]|nr:DUF3368 domain-containing protein [Acidobacteriaceae bacterium]
MIVVADTSPINYLILIDRISILEILYGRVFLPHAVHDELLHQGAPANVRSWAQKVPKWVEILAASKSLNASGTRLHPGEAEAIELAEQLHADWLLIDEIAGRDEATSRGLQTIGTLGILRDAHRTGLLDIHTALDKLIGAGFRVNKQLIAQLLKSI